VSKGISEPSIGRSPVRAGIGAMAFSISTVVALVVANPPGGNYKASAVTDYLAKGHRITVIVAVQVALLGLVGLVYLLAHFRQLLAAGPARSTFWGTGIAAAGAFAVGWGFVVSQVIAHWEGGSAIVVSPAVTYLISVVGIALIYGAGAILLGCALIVLMLNSSALLPSWLRWLTLVAGVAGIGGLAFFTFYVLMLWGVIVGLWLVAGGLRSATTELVSQPG
jgi:hypothetical protein